MSFKKRSFIIESSAFLCVLFYVKSQVFSWWQTDSFWICFMVKRNLQNQSSMSRHIFDSRIAAFPLSCFKGVGTQSAEEQTRFFRSAAEDAKTLPTGKQDLEIGLHRNNPAFIVLPPSRTLSGSLRRTGCGLRAFGRSEQSPWFSSYSCTTGRMPTTTPGLCGRQPRSFRSS